MDTPRQERNLVNSSTHPSSPQLTVENHLPCVCKSLHILVFVHKLRFFMLSGVKHICLKNKQNLLGWIHDIKHCYFSIIVSKVP